MGKHLDEAEQAYDDGYTAGRRAGFKELAAARAQIAELEAKLADIAKYGEIVEGAAKALGPRMEELTAARAQIAAKDAEIRTLRNASVDLLEQIAAKDAALDALDEAHQITQQNLWQDITELRASLAGKEQEHQDFRLQNDAEWRAKLDHLKAQIAAKDAEIAKFSDAFTALEAEVEAKDAALTHIVNECSRFPIKDGLAFRCESIALNALATPAREDGQ